MRCPTPVHKPADRLHHTASDGLDMVRVHFDADDRIDDIQQTDWLAQFTAADGTFAFDEVRRDIPHCLYLRRDGHATLVYDFPDDEKQRDEIDFGAITMPADMAPVFST